MGGKTKQKLVRVDADVKQVIDGLAGDYGVSISKLVEMSVDCLLDSIKKNGNKIVLETRESRPTYGKAKKGDQV